MWKSPCPFPPRLAILELQRCILLCELESRWYKAESSPQPQCTHLMRTKRVVLSYRGLGAIGYCSVTHAVWLIHFLPVFPFYRTKPHSTSSLCGLGNSDGLTAFPSPIQRWLHSSILAKQNILSSCPQLLAQKQAPGPCQGNEKQSSVREEALSLHRGTQ